MTDEKETDLMTNSKHISPGKEATKGQLQRTNSRRIAEADEDLVSAALLVQRILCNMMAKAWILAMRVRT